MRILYVSHTHPQEGTILDNIGGMQRVSRQLIDQLNTCSDVQVFTESINTSGAGFIVLKTTGFLFKQLVRLPKKVRKCGADIILFSSMVTASLAYFIRGRINIPMVTINHGRDVTLNVGIYQQFIPRVFEALDGIISVSSATRKECIKRGMAPKKGVVLPNGFNLQTMKDLPEKQKSRKMLQDTFNIPLDRNFMLLTVGRKVRRKGHEWFIRKVLPHITHSIVYVSIGDGPQLENIEQSVDHSTQQKKVFLLGRQPDIVLKQAYAAADLFIMPNIPVEGDMEGFGIVLLEANMAGTPAVASDLEGIKDVISSGKNGYKVPALDAEKFAGKVNRVLAGDLNKLSNRTREYVQNKFAWKEVARGYVAYLRGLITNNSADEGRN